jgi:hypothetical protein
VPVVIGVDDDIVEFILALNSTVVSRILRSFKSEPDELRVHISPLDGVRK